MLKSSSLTEIEQAVQRWTQTGTPNLADIWILKENIDLSSPPEEVMWYYESWEFLRMSLVNILTGKWVSNPVAWANYLVQATTVKMSEEELTKCQNEYLLFKERKINELFTSPIDKQPLNILYRWILLEYGEQNLLLLCTAWVSIIKKIKAMNVDTGGFYGNIAFNITDSKQGILLGRTSQELTSPD